MSTPLRPGSRRLVPALRRLAADRRGNVAPPFGLALVPLMLAAGHRARPRARDERAHLPRQRRRRRRALGGDPGLDGALRRRGPAGGAGCLPLPTNAWYDTWTAPFSGGIGTRMRDCASPDLHFEVSPTGGIAEAMDALFGKSARQARLSY